MEREKRKRKRRSAVHFSGSVKSGKHVHKRQGRKADSTYRFQASGHDVIAYAVSLYTSDGSNATPGGSGKRWTGYDGEVLVFYEVNWQKTVSSRT